GSSGASGEGGGGIRKGPPCRDGRESLARTRVGRGLSEAGCVDAHRGRQDKGVFLILDYPEENVDLMRALIKTLADTKSAAYPIRLLLLSRRDFDHWEAETLVFEGRFVRPPIAAPGDLSLANVLELIE